jgi:hypothetical protein
MAKIRGSIGEADHNGPHGEADGEHIAMNDHIGRVHHAGNKNPPNTVSMPIGARGDAAGGGYRSTGDKLDTRGSLGNTRQEAYNYRPGMPKGEGKMLGEHKSNFYNHLGGGGDESESGSGLGSYDRHIEGFGSGRDTFCEESNFYNDLGGKGGDGEDESGSGTVESDRSSRAKAVTGFSGGSGTKDGFI